MKKGLACLGNRRIEYLFVRVIIVLLAFLLFSCAGKSQNVKPAEFKLVKTTLAKDTKASGGIDQPLVPTQTFSTADEKVIAHVEFANLSGKHKIQWKWYDPDGRLYYASKKYQFKTNKQGVMKIGYHI